LKLEALNEAMQQHKISVPKPSSSGKGHALSAQDLYASLDSWILDSGASHHMTHSHELLPSTSIVAFHRLQLETLHNLMF
jgi:hypothetical protein